jgi:hypothetical protein
LEQPEERHSGGNGVEHVDAVRGDEIDLFDREIVDNVAEGGRGEVFVDEVRGVAVVAGLDVESANVSGSST